MATFTNNQIDSRIQNIKMDRSKALGLIIIGAFFAFEIFNFSTTDFALRDVLGELKFLGIRWSTMLAIAFCAIDFAGIAKMFTPQTNKGMLKETWFLFAAWILAAGMNAILTWWGVSVAFVNNGTLGASVIPQDVMLQVVPVFVAVMVWLIRVLVIGSLSLSTNVLIKNQPRKRVFQSVDQRKKKENNKKRSIRQPTPSNATRATSHQTYRKNNAYVQAQSDKNQNQQIYF